MTEAEWTVCADPKGMIPHLKRSKYPRLANREIRLYLVACARRIWQLLVDERSRHAIEVAERLADALATDEERLSAYQQAANACGQAPSGPPDATYFAWHCLDRQVAPARGKSIQDGYNSAVSAGWEAIGG